MKVTKVINNNIITSVDEHNREIILMGRGLGYKAKINHCIDPVDIQKKFILDNVSHSIIHLLMDIPMEYIEVSDEIIEYATKSLNKKINDNVFIALVDHIFSSIERYKENIKLKNVLLWEVKHFYKDEFAVGQFALVKIKEYYGIDMLEDEAAFIAIHFVTAQLEESVESVLKITSFMNEVIQFVESYFHIKLDADSSAYFRFTTHLKYFGQRLFTEMKSKNLDDLELLELVKRKYPQSYECTMQLKNMILEKYHYPLSLDECLYLTIHITKVV